MRVPRPQPNPRARIPEARHRANIAIAAKVAHPDDIRQGFQNMGDMIASIPHGSTSPNGYVPGPGGYYASGSTAGLLIRQLMGDRAARGLEGPQEAFERLAQQGQLDPRAIIHHNMLSGMMRK